MTYLDPPTDSVPPDLAPSEFFVTGGTLPATAASYVVRQADTDLLESLRRGEFCYVLNTRQMGKSSLMVRTAGRLRAAGMRVAVVDLTAVGQNLTPEQWYAGLLGLAAEQLDRDDALFTAWRAHRAYGPMQRFLAALRYGLFADGADDSPVVIFVDEIDAVRSLGFSTDELFAGIRECYNRRTLDPVYSRMTFCLLGVASPSDLISDSRMSPFNIGRRIELRDFTPGEAAPLTAGLRRAGREGTRLLERVLYWTGGHPYMTQRLCQAVAESEAEDAPAVDRICRSLFLTRAARESDDNLTFVRNRLLHSEADLPSLLDLYRRVRAGRRVPDDDTNPLASVLKLSGAARVEGGRLRVRNRIYAHVFDAEWVLTHMPDAELRRQRKAYRHGLVRAASVGAAVVVCVAMLAAVALHQASEARNARDAAQAASRKVAEQERTATSRLSRSYVASGAQLIEEGDYGRALAPLVEAMTLDGSDPDRTAMHRTRLASALALAPRLERMWFLGGPARWATFSPDKSRVAAAGDDGEAHVWDVRTGEELQLKMSHKGRVNFTAFSTDGRRLVTCGNDGYAYVWDLAARRLQYALHQPCPAGGLPRVTQAAWSPDGRRVATVGFSSVALWDLGGSSGAGTAKRILSDQAPGADVVSVSLAPRGDRLAFVSGNFRGWQIPVTGNRPAFPLGDRSIGGSFKASHAEYSADGSLLLVSGSFGGDGRHYGAALIDPNNGRTIRFLPHKAHCTYATFSPEGKRIVTTSEDQTARIWDAHTGRPLTPPLPHDGFVVHASFSADGRRVVTASVDGGARVWDAVTGAALSPPLRHAGAVSAVWFGQGDDLILTAGRDGTVRLWRLPPRAMPSLSLAGACTQIFVRLPGDTRLAALHTYNNGTGDIKQFSLLDLATGASLFPRRQDAAAWADFEVSDDGRRVLLFGPEAPGSSRPRKLQVWDATGSVPLSPVLADADGILDHDGNRLLLRSRDGKVRIVDVPTGRLLRPPFHSTIEMARRGDYAPAYVNPFTPDDRGVAVCDAQGSVRVEEVGTGKPLTPAMPHGAPVWRVAFSPNGRYLFTWTTKGIVRVWNVVTGAPASAPTDQNGVPEPMATGIRFSSDGKWAVSWGRDNDRRSLLWFLAGRGSLEPRPFGDGSSGDRFQFSPDGAWFIAIRQGPKIWSAQTAAPVTQALDPGAQVTNMAFSPDSRRVITACEDGTARVWDIRTSRPLTPPMRHGKSLRLALFSPDGRMAATASDDGPVRLWDAGTGEALAPPFPVRGQIDRMEFTADSRRLIVATVSDARVWTLPTVSYDLQTLQSLAQLLSGRRMDTNVGVIPMDAAGLRNAWESVRTYRTR